MIGTCWRIESVREASGDEQHRCYHLIGIEVLIHSYFHIFPAGEPAVIALSIRTIRQIGCSDPFRQLIELVNSSFFSRVYRFHRSHSNLQQKMHFFFLFFAHYIEWSTTTRIATTFDHSFSIFLYSEYFLYKVIFFFVEFNLDMMGILLDYEYSFVSLRT